jgi:flagellar protein FlaG
MEIDSARFSRWSQTTAFSLPHQEYQPRQEEFVPAVQAINEAALFGQQYELKFDMDVRSNRPLVRLVDRDTNEVVRQLPPEYVLRLAREVSRRSQP